MSVCDLHLICQRLSDHARVKYVYMLRSAFLYHQSSVPNLMDSLMGLKYSSPYMYMHGMRVYMHTRDFMTHILSSIAFAYPEGSSAWSCVTFFLLSPG